MKKILLLGGSTQQVIAIETAKRLGYETVLCDFLPDNPGQYAADRFYLISTTDREAVLEVAEKEHVDGVLAYASDPAAPTAAYVAEKLGLPTNPYASVQTLCNKDLFRMFLRENGFATPRAAWYSDKSVDTSLFTLPVIVKPVDSSGSKGTTVLRSWDGLDVALDFAFSFSRSHRLIIEEFIEKKHKYLVGGDVFISQGEVILWGLLNCHRDQTVNPLVPVGKSYPLLLEKVDKEAVEQTLQRMVDKLGLEFGSMNVELVIDQSNRVWLIDVGPRAGGNMIPDLLGDMFGIDLVEMTVEAAMGNSVRAAMHIPDGCYATHNLHSSRSGIYKEIVFSPKLEPYIYRKCLYKQQGDRVEYFDNASRCLGIVFFKFPDKDTMQDTLGHINELITVVLQ